MCKCLNSWQYSRYLLKKIYNFYDSLNDYFVKITEYVIQSTFSKLCKHAKKNSVGQWVGEQMTRAFILISKWKELLYIE